MVWLPHLFCDYTTDYNPYSIRKGYFVLYCQPIVIDILKIKCMYFIFITKFNAMFYLHKVLYSYYVWLVLQNEIEVYLPS